MDIGLENRTRCAVCGDQNLDPLKRIKNFPILPICTDRNIETDHFAPLDIVICQRCGCLQLGILVSRDIIYASPHSEGLGATWENHYIEFEHFLRSYGLFNSGKKVLEVGAGAGQLAEKIGNDCQLTIIEPNYVGKLGKFKLFEGFFTEEGISKESGSYDVIFSSHTLEHFFDFREYFSAAKLGLKNGGRLITAVPNLESALQAGYANALNFEHTAMLTLPHLILLHKNFGFSVRAVSYYKDHGIYLYAEKTGGVVDFQVDTRQYMTFLFDRFLNTILSRKEKIEGKLGLGIPSYIFGASQLSQFLFSCGLDYRRFEGLLDNAKTKSTRRLYGTNLISNLPEDTSKHLQNAQIFVNGGPYTEEICHQLKSITDERVELIRL